MPTQTLPSSFKSESTETGLLWGNGWDSGRSYGCRWPAGSWPVSHAWDPPAPPPASRQPPLSQRQGWVSGVCQGDRCRLLGGWLEHSSTSSDVCFTTSPLPTPAPRRPAFSLAMCLFGRKETGPAKAKDSGAPPSERLLGQWLCHVPYHPWGEAVWPEDWNLNAIVFDIVTFPLGRVNPPSRSFACVPTPPCPGGLPHSGQGVLTFKCEEMPLCDRT